MVPDLDDIERIDLHHACKRKHCSIQCRMQVWVFYRLSCFFISDHDQNPLQNQVGLSIRTVSQGASQLNGRLEASVKSSTAVKIWSCTFEITG